MSTSDAVARVTGRFAGRLAARAQTPGGVWGAQVASWLALADLCGELEEAVSFADEPGAELLQLHEAVLNLGIGTGGWLLHELKRNQIDASLSGEKPETLEASLETLRVFYNSRHARVPETELKLIQKRIFNAAA